MVNEIIHVLINRLQKWNLSLLLNNTMEEKSSVHNMPTYHGYLLCIFVKIDSKSQNRDNLISKDDFLF